MYSIEQVWKTPNNELDIYGVPFETNDPNMKKVIILKALRDRNELIEEDIKYLNNPHFEEFALSSNTYFMLKNKLDKDIESKVLQKIIPQIINGQFKLLDSFNENVFKGIDLNSNDMLIIKKYQVSGRREKFLEQELAILRYLKNKNEGFTVNYVDSFIFNNSFFVVTEFNSNYIDLNQFVKKYRDLNTAIYNFRQNENSIQRKIIEYSEIIRNLVEGLKFLHENQIIHRDIKPANVIIDPNTKRIKYIDFEFSMFFSDIDEKYNRISLGTKNYIDIVFDKNGSLQTFVASDLFSLGVTIFFLICGETVFEVYSEYVEDYVDEKIHRGNIYSYYVKNFNIEDDDLDDILAVKNTIERMNGITGTQLNLNNFLSRDINKRSLTC